MARGSFLLNRRRIDRAKLLKVLLTLDADYFRMLEDEPLRTPRACHTTRGRCRAATRRKTITRLHDHARAVTGACGATLSEEIDALRTEGFEGLRIGRRESKRAAH
jgi:hypothetical protein